MTIWKLDSALEKLLLLVLLFGNPQPENTKFSKVISSDLIKESPAPFSQFISTAHVAVVEQLPVIVKPPVLCSITVSLDSLVNVYSPSLTIRDTGVVKEMFWTHSRPRESVLQGLAEFLELLGQQLMLEIP